MRDRPSTSRWETGKEGRSNAEIVQGTERPGRPVKDVGVDHGGGNIVVPEQLRNGADVGAALQQVGGEGMPEGMGADVLRQTGTADARSVRNDSISASAGKRSARDRIPWKRANRRIHST